ncbi:MAG: methyltransferase domain-containing protein [Deltaproteobacteria bacterium]|nr:methyltransferase domain-containing protein [Deltaproteobacteria bacterium]
MSYPLGALSAEKNGKSRTCECVICGYKTRGPSAHDLGRVRGNTERFCRTLFQLWKCPKCLTIHSVEDVDLEDIYRDYPLNNRQLDIFARGTLRNLLQRLVRGGLKKTDTIIDFGCGNGVLIEYLERQGFIDVAGYDPFVPEYASLPQDQELYDCVVANDVIEHCDDPRAMMRDCLELVKPGGLFYVGTADSQGVENMNDLEPHIMRLHQPFHRVIITQESLFALGLEYSLEPIATYQRSYMDTLRPFINYRFLDEFSKALDHNMDLALDPASGIVVLRKPKLLFYAFFGYFFPSAYEPAVLWRRSL